MFWKQRKSDSDGFLDMLLRSGLLGKAELRNARRRAASDSLDELCQHLVRNGSITQWQCDKLLAGKHRGFFLDKYKIVGQIDKDFVSTSFLAIDLETEEQVGLRITPPNGEMPMEYVIVDL